MKKTLSAVALMTALAVALPVLAGGAGGGGGPGGGGFGGGAGGAGGFGGGAGGGGGPGGGGFVRLSTIDSIRQQIGFADDEWVVIQPKLQKVLDAQTALRLTTNARGGMGGGGGAGGGGFGGGAGGAGGFGGGPAGTTQPATQPDPVQVAQQELTTTLQNQESEVNVISAKLKALREARTKAKENLTKAQDDLKKVLTVRQEAFLVNLGYLE